MKKISSFHIKLFIILFILIGGFSYSFFMKNNSLAGDLLTEESVEPRNPQNIVLANEETAIAESSYLKVLEQEKQELEVAIKYFKNKRETDKNNSEKINEELNLVLVKLDEELKIKVKHISELNEIIAETQKQ